MEKEYDKNGVYIGGLPNESGRACMYQRDDFSCQRSPHRLFAVQRWGAIFDGLFCGQHKNAVVRAAEKDADAKEHKKGKITRKITHINNLLGHPDLSNFFDELPVSRLRCLGRLDLEKDASLDDLVKKMVNLKPAEYLVIPEDVPIVDKHVSPERFRSNGFFLVISPKKGKTLREAAKEAIKQMDPTARYAGMRHIDPVDNIRREYALVTLIEGYMLSNLLGARGKRKGLHFVNNEGNPIQIECEKKYLGSGSFCFYVPSSSNPKDKSYRVDLKEIATGEPGTRRYRGRYGFKYDCTCEASVKEELTLSDMNSFGEPYANSKIRPCKHAYAALASLEEHGIIPSHEPRTPVKPTDVARRFKMKLSRQVLHGNNHLSRIEQEVILMRAIAPHLLGYERMFEAR